MAFNPQQFEVSHPENLPNQDNVGEFLNEDEMITQKIEGAHKIVEAEVKRQAELENVGLTDEQLKKLEKIGKRYPEKWGDEEYRQAVIKLEKGGITIDWILISDLTLGKAKDKEYIEVLIRLQSEGIEVNNWTIEYLDLEKAKDNVYMEIIFGLIETKINVDSWMISTLEPEKAKDKEYIAALIRLQAGGVEVDGWMTSYLDLEKAKDKEYIEALIRLQAGGFEVDGFTNRDLLPDIVKDREYLSALIKLRNGRIKVDDSMMAHLIIEKAKNKEYIAALIRLQAEVIEVDASTINVFDLEKAKDEEYIAALIRLQAEGIEVNNWTIDSLDLEKAKNKEYIETLIRLQAGGVEVGAKIVGNLNLERSQDEIYMRALEAAGDVSIADRDYIEMNYPLRDQDVLMLFDSEPSEVLMITSELRQVGELTPVALQIVDIKEMQAILPTIRKINDLHNETIERRQEVIKDLPLNTYFTLALHGRAELFTSSFQKVLYPLIMQKMEAGGKDAMDWIQENDPNFENFRLVIALFSRFDRLEEFLGTIKDKEKLGVLLEKLIFGLDANGNGALESAIAISETMAYVDKRRLSKRMEQLLVEAHGKAEGDTKLLYSLIGSLHKNNARTNSGFFREVNEKYPLKPMFGIEASELINQDNEIIQQVIFYNDKDGRGSYNHMMDYYSGDPTWKTEDHDSWVLLKRQQGELTVLKYVNKPEEEETGMEAVQKAMKEKDLSAIQVTHRGHSYHVDKTLPHIPAQAKIVFLGSCGGFNNINAVLNKAPGAHIIATKGTGTMLVNDPLLKMLDAQMLGGSGVDWNDLWDTAEDRIRDERFNQYINPSRNISAQFINAYRKYKKKETVDK